MGKHGPILSSSDDLFKECGNPNDLKSGKGVYGGEPGFPEESKGKNPHALYEETGTFGESQEGLTHMSMRWAWVHLIVMLSVAPRGSARAGAAMV